MSDISFYLSKSFSVIKSCTIEMRNKIFIKNICAMKFYSQQSILLVSTDERETKIDRKLGRDTLTEWDGRKMGRERR